MILQYFCFLLSSNAVLFVRRVIPRFLAWLVKRRYKIYLRVGHISLPYFILRDVNVSKNGFTLVSPFYKRSRTIIRVLVTLLLTLLLLSFS